MICFGIWYNILAFATILLFHALSVFLPGIWGKAVGFVNIILHPVLLMCLWYSHCPLDEVVLLFLASCFCLLLLRSLRLRHSAAVAEKGDAS